MEPKMLQLKLKRLAFRTLYNVKSNIIGGLGGQEDRR